MNKYYFRLIGTCTLHVAGWVEFPNAKTAAAYAWAGARELATNRNIGQVGKTTLQVTDQQGFEVTAVTLSKTSVVKD